MPTIDVKIAVLEEKPIFANMMQFYIHDFSELWAGEDGLELEADGRFADYEYLDAYWREPERTPLLFRIDGRLAGFGLLNAHSHIGRPVDHNMAEFFVARKYRRSGAGTAAAHAIFGLYPGSWEVAVMRRNVGALPFWRLAIEGLAGVREIEALDVATDEWNGPLFRFRTGPGAR